MAEKRLIIRIVAIFLTLVLALALTPPSQVAKAATITVTSTSGGTGDPGCTLRDSITAANTDTATGGCPAGNGDDTINLASGATYTLTTVDNNISGPNGLPSINSEITIEGNGATIERSSAGGIPSFRIFHVEAEGDLTLNRLTINNGLSGDYPGDKGGGIFNRGTVEATSTIFSGNDGAWGGGICNEGGTLILTNSTISNNVGGGIGNGWNSEVTLNNSTVRGNDGSGIIDVQNSTLMMINTIVSGNSATDGGGIQNWDSTATLINSTVNGNTAGNSGGGILNVGGTLTLINSTVSGNDGSHRGGGIMTEGETVTLTNSTISGNLARYGGGITSWYGEVMLTNTIVAVQLLGTDCGPWDPVTSLGHNLDSDGTCNLTATGDISGADPHLGPLQNNGGSTLTHALLPGSPAIDAIPLASCIFSTDQRGVHRPQGSACDIGAFEAEVVQVIIDIKPGSDPNSINLASPGVVPVAILTTDDFDAITVDPTSVIFAGASPLRWATEDVDLDGDIDLMFHFKTQELNLIENSTEAMIEGNTFSGLGFWGIDTVKIIQ